MKKQETKILIIEDDLIIAENLKENLSILGYHTVVVCSNYKTCIETAKSYKPDLFLVDIYLQNSEKNGIEIMLSLFNQMDKPLIYTSALTDVETRGKAKTTNPSAYLVKPFSIKQLDVAIDFALTEQIIKHKTGYKISVDHCPFISEPDFFYIKHKDKYEKISKSDIIYLKSEGSYTDIYTTDKKFRHYLNLKTITERLRLPFLVRCHNSYAVNINFIQSYDNDCLYIVYEKVMTTIPLSNIYKVNVLEELPKL